MRKKRRMNVFLRWQDGKFVVYPYGGAGDALELSLDEAREARDQLAALILAQDAIAIVEAELGRMGYSK